MSSVIVHPVPRRPDAPRLARRQVHELAGTLPGDLLWAVELVVSELVTNAVMHGAGQITLTLELVEQGVLVGVDDEGGGTPVARATAEMTNEDGRGIAMIARLAKEWGIRQRPHGGKVVWCLLTEARTS